MLYACGEQADRRNGGHEGAHLGLPERHVTYLSPMIKTCREGKTWRVGRPWVASQNSEGGDLTFFSVGEGGSGAPGLQEHRERPQEAFVTGSTQAYTVCRS